MEKTIAKHLVNRYNLKVKHAAYREGGDSYIIPKKFPAALFDLRGYVLFNDEQDYVNFLVSADASEVYEDKVTDSLTVRRGISRHRSYFRFPIFPDEFLEPAGVIEDARRSVVVNAYERDITAMAACTTVHGRQCSVCAFDFEREFGEIGHRFIHVHHLTPISSVSRYYELNPVEHLRPICLNCHAMLHSQEPPLTIDELRKIRESRPNKPTS